MMLKYLSLFTAEIPGINVKAGEYIQNMLPIRLLSLSTMEIVSKADIKNNLESAIANVVQKKWNAPVAEQNAGIHKLLEQETGYAILSHRWLPEGELSYQDILPMTKNQGQGKNKLKKMIEELDNEGDGDGWRRSARADEPKGLPKVIKFCKVASQYGCKYAWFDTGCINQESSAELQESIRSMFNWYRHSTICIVHLSETTDALDICDEPWFTRGWTLQELLAPTKLKFYDQSWIPLTSAPNDKTDIPGVPLWQTISDITKIPIGDLLSFKPGIQNVRQKMVWASGRQTTRIEDMAYCLIGIFDVALPIAYGEGKMAFYRLQMEIMQRSDDKALFAWQGTPSPYNSMLAAGPDCFVPPYYHLRPDNTLQVPGDVDTTYALTNRGLRIRLPIYEAMVEAMDRGSADGEYKLRIQGLGTINAVALPDNLTLTNLKVALLGDALTSTSISVAVLLYINANTLQHKKIATKNVVVIKRPNVEALEYQTIFIS